ncbi:hypothetical protein Tco_0517622 [Tanacetum coccineum]
MRVDGHGKETDKHQSEDPFGFYDLLNKLPAKGVRDASTSLSHPPGFTPKTSVTHANVGEICEDGPTNGEDMVNMPRVDAKVMDHSQEFISGTVALLLAPFTLDDKIGLQRWTFYSGDGTAEAIIMGDFNDSSGLVDVKFEGTWKGERFDDDPSQSDGYKPTAANINFRRLEILFKTLKSNGPIEGDEILNSFTGIINKKQVDLPKAMIRFRWDYLLRNLQRLGLGLIGVGGSVAGEMRNRVVLCEHSYRYLGIGPFLIRSWGLLQLLYVNFKVPKGVLKTMESIHSKFFNGVDSSDRKISWVAWDNVLASKLNGGLGVSSFFALNRALLLKWVWRFILAGA